MRLLLVAAASFATGALPVANATPDAPVTSDSITDFDAVLSEASRLASDGSVVHARSLVFELMANYKLELTDAQRSRARTMEAEFDARVSGMDPYAVALETAQLGLSTDDLLTAETKARKVLNAQGATGAQQAEARRLLDGVTLRRVQLAPAAPLAVDRAVNAFEQGDYETCKREMDRVVRLGVALDSQREQSLAQTRERLAEIELNRGETIPAGLTLFGPVKSDWLLATADDTQPATDTQPPAQSQPDELTQAQIFAAKSILGEANLAFEERRLNEAVLKYNRVLTDYRQYLSDAEVQQAQSRRDEAQVQLMGQGGPTGEVLTDVERQRELQRQQIRATFDNLMQQVDRALASGNTSNARTLASQARTEAQRGLGVFSQSEYESFLSRYQAKISEINASEEAMRIAEAEARSQEIERENARSQAEMQRTRDRQILEAIDRVRALQMELKFQEALQVVEDQILFLDPQNPVGLLLRDVLRRTALEQEYAHIQSEKGYGFAQERIAAERSMIAPEDVMAYPENWRQLSQTRIDGLEGGETAENRATLAALESARMPIDFSDNPLSDVIDFIATNAGVDSDVDWTSLEDIGIDRDMPVTLRLSSATPASTVLDRVLQQVSDPALPAEWAVIDGILVIASDDVLRRNTMMRSYDIRDLLFEVPNFDNAPDFDLQTSSGSGGGGQSPFQGSSGQDEDRLPREERVDNLVQVIQNNVDPNGWIELGGNTGAIQELSGVLIITQTPKAHRAITSLLDMLRDVRAVQINVEARFLLVSQGFFEQIGFDLDVYFTDNNQFELNQLIDPSIDGSDYYDENGNLVDNVIGGGVFLIDTDGDGTVEPVTISQPVNSPNTIGDEWSIIGGRQNSFGLTEQLAGGATSIAASVLGANPALGVTGRFLDDIQVDFLVEATQADERTVTLTAPRLTFTNGQRAWVAVTRDQAYVSDLQPIVSDGSAAFDPTIDVAQDGVVLDIEGVVSNDRRYVTMTVITGISDLTFGEAVTVEAVAGGGTVFGGDGDTSSGAGVAEGFIQIPIARQTIIRTTVTVPDQGTLLLGGQRLVTEVEVETGVPVLSKIPILSRFFSNRIDTKEERTLLILIRPQILIQDEEEERNFPGLLDQLGLE
ncbi:MAG: hypothetical protein ACF8Q5_02870 [Phycisphaerales bacterium JB040]